MHQVTRSLVREAIRLAGERELRFRPWKGQYFPERLEVNGSVVSRVRFLRVPATRTFVVGAPMKMEATVRNTGTTPMPSEPPNGPGVYWRLTIEVT